MNKNELNFDQIGHNLRMLRARKELSCEKVGEYTGIDYKTISHYENGRRMTLDKLNTLAIYYSCSLDELVNKKAKITIEFE